MATTEELVQQAQAREYTNFDASTKDILSQKVAEKLQDQGYFDRLAQAQNQKVNEDITLNEMEQCPKCGETGDIYDIGGETVDGKKYPQDTYQCGNCGKIFR